MFYATSVYSYTINRISLIVCIGVPTSPSEPPPPYEYKDSNPRLSQCDGVLDCWMEALQQEAYNPAFPSNALAARQQQLKERQ